MLYKEKLSVAYTSHSTTRLVSHRWGLTPWPLDVAARHLSPVTPSPMQGHSISQNENGGLGPTILKINHVEEMVFILVWWCVQVTYPQFIDAYGVSLSICPFKWPFGFGLVRVGVGGGEGCRHYWGVAVAINGGYGGYMLPLMAAHSC